MHCVNTRILINAKIVWVKGMIDIYKAFRNARARTEYFNINACMYDFKPLYNRPLPSLSNSNFLSVTHLHVPSHLQVILISFRTPHLILLCKFYVNSALKGLPALNMMKIG